VAAAHGLDLKSQFAWQRKVLPVWAGAHGFEVEVEVEVEVAGLGNRPPFN